MSSCPKVVVTHRVHNQVKQVLAGQCEVVANDGAESWTRSRLIGLAGDAQALMAFTPDRIDEPFLAACPQLRVIAAAMKGYDNIDVAACTSRGIWVTAVPDLLSGPTAELALALILGITRNVLPGDRLIRNGSFQGWRPALYGGGLLGKTVGVVGMGKVGQAFVRLLGGFNVRIIYFDPVRMSPVQEAFFGLSRMGFEEVVAQSDILVLMLPLSASTLHLFDSQTIAKMKPGAYLVNVGRGSVVDENAVSLALEQGRLAGYAADVFEVEDHARADRPEAVHRGLLANPDRTLLTPHLGTAVDTVRLGIELSAARSILQALCGERPVDAINEVPLSENLAQKR